MSARYVITDDITGEEIPEGATYFEIRSFHPVKRYWEIAHVRHPDDVKLVLDEIEELEIKKRKA